MTALADIIEVHRAEHAHEVDRSAFFAQVWLRERVLFHQRGLGQKARQLFGVDQRKE